MSATAKNYAFGAPRAPRHIQLFGDKSRPESAEHIIEFPGGAIEVARTTSGEYWVHIIVNRKQVVSDAGTLASKEGCIIESRAFSPNTGFIALPDLSDAEQFAVKVATR